MTPEEDARIAREVVSARLPWWWRLGREQRFMVDVDRFAIAYSRWREASRQDTLSDLVELIERLHVPEAAENELHECIGYQEGQACCLDRLRASAEFAAAKRNSR